MSSVRVKGAENSNRNFVKKMIEDIKEITAQNHSDEEIHAMLRECSMDPNEAAHRLLLLDKFHEVKSKRERRKENQIKELAEMKWKPGTQARANRGGRGNYSSRYRSNDAGGRMALASAKESGTGHLSEKGVNYLSSTVSPSMSKYKGLPPLSAHSGPIKSTKPLIKDIQLQQTMNLGKSAISNASSPAPYMASSAPVLVPSQESFPHAVGPIRHKAGSDRALVGVIVDNSTTNKLASVGDATPEVGISVVEQKVPNESDTLLTASSEIRPSSNYNNPSQVIGSQKVGPVREWKPKSVSESGGNKTSPSEVPVVSDGTHSELLKSPVAVSSKETNLDLQKKLGKLSVSHVIIPEHLHVPEVDKLGVCFGSFDASFGLDMNKHGGLKSEETLPISESSESMDVPVNETQMSNQNESVAVDNTESEYPEPLESHSPDPENLQSGAVLVPSSNTIDNMPKEDLAPGTHQHHVGHPPSDYNLSLVPSILSSQFAPSLSSDSQAHDAPGQPAFAMLQSFDPSSYYAQFYRPGMDASGCISPFHTGGAIKSTLVSAPTSQTPQEGGFPLILPTAAPTTLVTQAAGVMQSSTNPTQQPFPVFRQPSGVPLPHYNYNPYGPYFSPYYVPPPTITPFLSNPAFPQQFQPGSLYPTATGATAKYSLPQYKQGSNTGASNLIGVPGSYGAYGLSMAHHSPGSATAPVTSAANENRAATQAKETNVYASGQQNDGSSVWFATPNRDVVHASPLYNLPQGQLAYTPTQQGHGAFTRFLHPAQAMNPATIHHPLLQQSQTITNPADIGGQNTSVYQQPHHAQINWPGNY